MTPAQRTAAILTLLPSPAPQAAAEIEHLFGRPITRCPYDRSSSISTADLCRRILEHDRRAQIEDTGQPDPGHPRARRFNGRTITAVLPKPNGRPHPHWARRILPGRTTVAELRRRGVSRYAIADAIAGGWLRTTSADGP
jgi:hypothetical protein